MGLELYGKNLHIQTRMVKKSFLLSLQSSKIFIDLSPIER